MQEQIEVSAKYKITLETDSHNRPCASLVLNTPKGRYTKEKIVRSYFFKDENSRYAWAVKTASNILEQERLAADRKRVNKMAAKNAGIEVGSIFSHSWGYDQTNIQYYEVVKMSGQTATLREVAQNREHTGWEQGTCTPIKGDFIGKEFKKRIQVSGSSIYISTECGWCELWDGRPDHWTAYA